MERHRHLVLHLIAPRRVATPEIKQKVAELTAGISDPLEKIRALAAFTQRQIRYAAIEIGIGGHQPHAAGDVLGHRYGDCKDKATLLNTMLQEIGIDSYNVMISPQRGLVRPGFPMLCSATPSSLFTCPTISRLRASTLS